MLLSFDDYKKDQAAIELEELARDEKREQDRIDYIDELAEREEHDSYPENGRADSHD